MRAAATRFTRTGFAIVLAMELTWLAALVWMACRR